MFYFFLVWRIVLYTYTFSMVNLSEFQELLQDLLLEKNCLGKTLQVDKKHQIFVASLWCRLVEISSCWCNHRLFLLMPPIPLLKCNYKAARYCDPQVCFIKVLILVSWRTQNYVSIFLRFYSTRKYEGSICDIYYLNCVLFLYPLVISVFQKYLF